jgi:uncharacterized protein (TIGR04222 family)
LLNPNPMQNLLWEKLQQFDLDGGVPFSFSRRLARDNGWSHDFALRVCQEYKKFLYLACTAGHVVSPSEEVDQAWHLHLTYTRSYWEELCPNVLGMPLHHDPSRGRKAEAGKFENLYERTLESYLQAFGASPPLDIWPPTAVRFGEVTHFRRINLKRHYVLAKPKLSSSNFKLAPVLALAAVLAGCSASGSLNPFEWYGGEFLNFYWTLCGLAVLLNFWLRMQMSWPSDENFPSKRLDPYHLARLSDSGSLPIDAALCALQAEGAIQVDGDGIISHVPGASPPNHPFELKVWEQINFSNRLETVRHRLRDAPESFDGELQNAGLLLPPDRQWNVAMVTVGLSAVLLIVGIIKITVGLERERPVGYLVGSCLLMMVLAFVYLKTSPPYRTWRGERYLRSLRDSIARAEAYDPTMAVSAVVVGAALRGYGELESNGFAGFRRQQTYNRAYAANNRSSTANSSSSFWGGTSSGGDSGGYSSGHSGGDSGGSSDSGNSSDSGGSSCGGGSGCGGCGGGGGD